MWDRFLRQRAYIGITRSCMRWYVRKDFLSQGKISDIRIRCARKDFLSQGKISGILIRCAEKKLLNSKYITLLNTQITCGVSNLIHDANVM